MPRNSANSLRTAAADSQATYGCVDWYLYQSSPTATAPSTGPLDGARLPAPSARIIERAVAAAAATVTAVTRAAAPSEAAARQSSR